MSDSRYVATEDIFVSPHVRAFKAGSVVPADLVDALGARDKVQGANTKAAKAAVVAAVEAAKPAAEK